MTATETPQYARALDLANHIRIENANLRRRLRALPEHEARRELILLLTRPDDAGYAGALPIGRLLTFPAKWGTFKATKILNMAGVRSADRRLRDLSPRQRRIIAEALGDPASIFAQSRLPRIEVAA